MNSRISIRLDPSLEERLAQVSKERGLPRSLLINQGISKVLDEIEIGRNRVESESLSEDSKFEATRRRLAEGLAREGGFNKELDGLFIDQAASALVSLAQLDLWQKRSASPGELAAVNHAMMLQWKRFCDSMDALGGLRRFRIEKKNLEETSEEFRLFFEKLADSEKGGEAVK